MYQNSKEENAEGRNCVNVVAGKEFRKVIPVGLQRGPCLDMKLEILGHSGSASHLAPQPMRGGRRGARGERAGL